MLGGRGEKNGAEGGLSIEKLNRSPLLHCVPLGFLNSGLGFYGEGSQRRFLGLQKKKLGSGEKGDRQLCF